MKTILVPIDFSQTSQHALRYAKRLAERLDAALKVVHFDDSLVQIEQPLVVKAGMTRTETLESHLRNFVNTPAAEEDGTVETTVKIDLEIRSNVSASKGIIQLTKEADHLLTVMGTTGSHDALERLFGSVSTEVAQQAVGPVILVPQEAKLDVIDHVLFASNYESADAEILEDMTYFAQLFQSKIHFVHVSDQKDGYDSGTRDHIFDLLFQDDTPSFSFEMSTIPNHSVVQGLKQYAEDHAIDLIVLVNRDRGLIDNFLQRSITQQIGLFTKVPLMVFHHRVRSKMYFL